MSVASTLLASGFAANLRVHGETLGYISPGQAVASEWGELITDEQGNALLGSETSVDVTGIFDEAYVSVAGAGGELGNIEVAAIVKASDVDGVTRGAFITRGEDIYFVKQVGDAACDGSQVLLLSRQAH